MVMISTSSTYVSMSWCNHTDQNIIARTAYLREFPGKLTEKPEVFMFVKIVSLILIIFFGGTLLFLLLKKVIPTLLSK